LWKLDLELQGHYIEFCEKNYPEVVEKIGKPVDKGQVEFVPAHYSDQTYVAYPRYNFEKS